MKRIFYLTSGQQPPEGSTCEGMPDGGIVWIGDEWLTASGVEIYPGIESHEMTKDEEQIYSDIQEYNKTETRFEITFDEFRDDTLLAAKKAEISQKMTTITKPAPIKTASVKAKL